ncbi:MAG: hypothetical protein WAW06_02320, partial [bacterium]
APVRSHSQARRLAELTDTQPVQAAGPSTGEIRAWCQANGVPCPARGLRVKLDFPGDDWYGYGTLPIRLTIPDNWPLWPIEREVDQMFSVRPVIWPDDEGDEES